MGSVYLYLPNMKHQVLQVLILAVLTQAEKDGHGAGASSSSLYPNTFFGASTGRGSTNLGFGNERSGFGNFDIGRSEKSLSLGAVPAEHSQSEFERTSERFHQAPRGPKAEIFNRGFTPERNPVQKHTFFDAPLRKHGSPSTFGSSNIDSGHENVGRIGKTASFESSPQIKHVRLNQEPQAQNVDQGIQRFRGSEIRNFDQIHEDVQRVVSQGPQLHEDVQRQLQILPTQQIPQTQRGNTQSPFAFRNSRNEVKTLQEIHAEIEELKRNQNELAHQEQRILQVQHAASQGTIPAEHQRAIPVQEVHAQQRVIPAQLVQRQNLPQQNFHGSSNGAKFRPVQTTFVHHDNIQKNTQNQFINSQQAQHIIHNEIPDVHRVKGNPDNFRSGKSESFESAVLRESIERHPSQGSSAQLEAEQPRIGKQHNTFFGAPSNNQQDSRNFFTSERIGKANSLEKSNAQVPPLVLLNTQTQHRDLGSPGALQTHQLNHRNPQVGNSQRFDQNVRPAQSFNLNQGDGTHFVSQVHGFQATPVQIQSLPNIRPEIRGSVAQTQHIQAERHNLQRFPQTVQLHDRTVENSPRPANNGAFTQEFHTFPRPAQIRTQQNVQPIQDFRSASHGFETTPHQVQRFPDHIQSGNGNLRNFQNERPASHVLERVSPGVQVFPQRQNIHTGRIQAQSSQSFEGNPQNSPHFLQPLPLNRGLPQASKRVHGLQGSNSGFRSGSQNEQRFPQPIHRNSSPVAEHQIQNDNLGPNIVQNEAFNAHRDSFFASQNFQANNELKI